MSGASNVKLIKNAITAKDLNDVFTQLMKSYNNGSGISTTDMCSLLKHVMNQNIAAYPTCGFLGLLFSQNVHKNFSDQEKQSIYNHAAKSGDVTNEYVRSVL